MLWTAAGRIARRISRPLYELTRAAQEIGQGNLAARAPAGQRRHRRDRRAVVGVQRHGGRLERQLTEQRELLAAVSHELRTPLARIRLLVEIARQASGRATARQPPANVTLGTLDEIEREAIEIDTLVGELLASARLEFQARDAQAAGGGGGRAPGAGARRRRRGQAGAGRPRRCRSSPIPTLIARALANLIDNARKHGGGLDAHRGARAATARSCSRSAIAARASRPATRRACSIASIAAAADAGTTARSGSGLALVRRIAVAHGGRAEAGNRPGGGARVTLELPRRRAGLTRRAHALIAGLHATRP